MTSLVRFLHVLSMASWLAATLWLAGDARRALAAGPQEAQAFLARARAALRLDRVAGAATLVTGLAMLHFAQAWPPRPGLWLGMALAAVRLGLGDALVRPELRAIGAALAARSAPADLLPRGRRIAAAAVGGHVAWLGALVGMLLV